jgi:ribosomal protein S18 acetylase RimI-like enzyme
VTLSFRKAQEHDLPVILALLADDVIGRNRETLTSFMEPDYLAAFQVIADDPNNHLIVAMEGVNVVGFCQLTFIPGLSRRGAWRCQIESVRVSKSRRSEGIGAALMRHVIDLARQKNCQLVQLTSDKQRDDAHRFYSQLGFTASHDGFKMLIQAISA